MTMSYAEAKKLERLGPKVLGETQWAEVQQALTPASRLGLGPRVTGVGELQPPIPLRESTKTTPTRAKTRKE